MRVFFSGIFQTFVNGCLCSAADGRHRLPERWSRCCVLVPTCGRSRRRAEHGGTYVLFFMFAFIPFFFYACIQAS